MRPSRLPLLPWLLLSSAAARAHVYDLSESPLHFVDDFGFDAGGAWTLSASLSWGLSSLAKRNLFNRTLAHLLICDESVIGVSSRTLSVVPQGDRSDTSRGMSLLTKWQFCTDGNYANVDLCQTIPFVKPTENVTSGYTETLNISSRSIGSRTHLYFFVTNCEVWGSDQTENQYGGTRYPNSCKASGKWNASTRAIDYTERTVPCPNLKPGSASLEINNKMFRNPGGFLSFTEAPFIPMYSILVPLWLVLCVAWWVNTFVFACKRHIVSLQKKMMFVPLTRLLFVSIAMWHWRLNNTESPDDGAFGHNAVRIGLYVADVLYRCVFNEVLLLMSKGWQITRRTLHVQERRNIRGLMFMYAASWGVYYLSLEVEAGNSGNDEESGVRVAFIGLVVLTTMFLIILYTIWFSVSQQLVVLSYQLNLIRAYNVNPRTTPIWIKFEMLRVFRQAFAFYLLLNAAADIMMASHQRSSPWVPVMCDEILEFLVVALIGWTFRAQDFSPYFERVRRASLQAEAAAAAAVANGNNGAGADNGRRQWVRGMPLPAAPESMFHPSRSRVVVFVNPDGGAGLGATAVEGKRAPLSPGTLIAKGYEEDDSGGIEMRRMGGTIPKQRIVELRLPPGSELGFEMSSVPARNSTFSEDGERVRMTVVSEVVYESLAREVGVQADMQIASINGMTTAGNDFIDVLRTIERAQAEQVPLIITFAGRSDDEAVRREIQGLD